MVPAPPLPPPDNLHLSIYIPLTFGTQITYLELDRYIRLTSTVQAEGRNQTFTYLCSYFMHVYLFPFFFFLGKQYKKPKSTTATKILNIFENLTIQIICVVFNFQNLNSEIAKFENKEFMKDKKERKEFIAHPINKALSKVQTVSSRGK